MAGLFDISWGWDFVVRLLSITLIDLALSGDNAIVIGMAAASLPHYKRRKAIVLGGALAILLRITLTSVATFLMRVPLLSAVGGLVLFWVAWKLLRVDIEESEGDGDEAVVNKNFRQAIFLIVTADFMMSLDNVIAVAGSAHGSIFLLIVGLFISMPLLMVTGGLISNLIDRFRWLPHIGAAVIVFTGTRMILEDSFLEPHLLLATPTIMGISIITGLLITAVFVRIHRRTRQIESGHD
jgi:YjbE family integral membrane protein